jgi:DNA polymerase eta
VPVEQLKKKISDDTGTWLYNIIRGEDQSEVNPRTQIKSMLSAKSFRPSINTLETAVRWIRIFVADIFSRLVEEGVLENKRRPKTLNLYHRQGAQTRSKSASIPMGRTMDETLLFDIAKGLLAQVIAEGRAWPCANLSLSVSGFEEGVTGNKGIGGFLLRGDEAKAISAAVREPSELRNPETPPPNKRRRVEESGIQRFFGARQGSSGGNSEREEQDLHMSDEIREAHSPFEVPPSAQIASDDTPKAHAEVQSGYSGDDPSRYTCDRCNSALLVTEQGEHDDWHFAKDLAADLAAEERANTAAREQSRPPSTSTSTQPKSKGRGRPPNVVKAEKGQKKLKFG